MSDVIELVKRLRSGLNNIDGGELGGIVVRMNEAANEIERLSAALAAQKAEQPVAWISEHGKAELLAGRAATVFHQQDRDDFQTALYYARPSPSPVTCPIGLDKTPDLCSAGYCPKCLEIRGLSSPSPSMEVEQLREALAEAANGFEEIRLILIRSLQEPERKAFWKAVESRNKANTALSPASLPQTMEDKTDG